MEKRHKSRITALEMLYAYDVKEELELLNEQTLPKAANDLNKDLTPFSEEIILGVAKDINKINDLIEDTAKNWKVSRMGVIDRNILRIGIFEIINNTPKAVVINEAVLLANQFGSENSSSFINGILDNIKIK